MKRRRGPEVAVLGLSGSSRPQARASSYICAFSRDAGWCSHNGDFNYLAFGHVEHCFPWSAYCSYGSYVVRFVPPSSA